MRSKYDSKGNPSRIKIQINYQVRKRRLPYDIPHIGNFWYTTAFFRPVKCTNFLQKLSGKKNSVNQDRWVKFSFLFLDGVFGVLVGILCVLVGIIGKMYLVFQLQKMLGFVFIYSLDEHCSKRSLLRLLSAGSDQYQLNNLILAVPVIHHQGSVLFYCGRIWDVPDESFLPPGLPLNLSPPDCLSRFSR